MIMMIIILVMMIMMIVIMFNDVITTAPHAPALVQEVQEVHASASMQAPRGATLVLVTIAFLKPSVLALAILLPLDCNLVLNACKPVRAVWYADIIEGFPTSRRIFCGFYKFTIF